MIPLVGVLILTGCASSRDLYVVKTMFEEMKVTYQTPEGNTMFTEWGVKPQLNHEVFEEGTNGEPNDYVKTMSEDLMIGYSQVQYLYASVLEVATNYLDQYTLYVFDNEESVRNQRDLINALYNQVIALRKEVYSFSRTKDGFLEELEMIQPDSAIYYEKLKNFCHAYASLIKATLDYANTMRSLNAIIKPHDLSILNDENVSDEAKNDMIQRVFDDAKLTYATIVYYDNIEIFQHNNLSETFQLQYYEDGKIQNYSLSKIDELTSIMLTNDVLNIDSGYQTIGQKAKNMELLQEKMSTYLNFYNEAREKVNVREYYEALLKDEYNEVFSTGVATKYAENYYNALSNEQKGCLDFIIDFTNLDVRYFYEALMSMTK